MLSWGCYPQKVLTLIFFFLFVSRKKNRSLVKERWTERERERERERQKERDRKRERERERERDWHLSLVECGLGMCGAPMADLPVQLCVGKPRRP